MKTKSLLPLIILLTTIACKKSGQNPGATTSTGDLDVYVAGNVTVAPSFTQATVWKNGVQTTLSTDNSSAFDITSQGKNVYILGEDHNGFCYWKNNVRIQVTNNQTNYSAYKIAVQGNDVYTAGSVYTKGDSDTTGGADYSPAYSKNGIITKLTSPSGYAVISGLALKGNDVYICGYYYTPNNYKQIPCYWKNGVLTILDKDTTKTSTPIAIAVNGNDVYVIINSLINPLGVSQHRVFLWKNGTTTLIDKDADSFASGIFINGNEVYISGVEEVPVPISGFPADYHPFQGGYWKNGILNKLPNITSSNAIAVQGNDIYVAGNYLSGNLNDAACWKNGVITNLGIQTHDDVIRGITLVSK